MDGLLTLLLFAGIFFFMMRWGCGAHAAHGHGGHGSHEHGRHDGTVSGAALQRVRAAPDRAGSLPLR